MFKPITRLAVVEATVAVMLAGIFILPDLGRPERVINILLHANLTSPMVWDITIVIVYTLLSALYVWLYTRADLARRGSRLALGTGTSRARPGPRRAHEVGAWPGSPCRRRSCCTPSPPGSSGSRSAAASGTRSIMAPMFIASALVSGLALVILLALVLRRARPVAFGDDLVAFLGGLLGVFIAVEAFLVLAEYLTAGYPGAPGGVGADRAHARRARTRRSSG